MTEQTPSTFYVHRIYPADGIRKLTREDSPHNGHQSYEQGKQWIDDYGERQEEYVILEVFKKP